MVITRTTADDALVVSAASLAAVLVVSAAVALSGCSSSPAAPPPAAPVAAAPVAANPVTLLTQAGATPDPGEVTGSTDVEGDRYATGSFPGGEGITVDTFTSPAAQSADLARNGIPGDAHAFITGHLANYYVTAVDGPNGYTFSVTPAQIAVRTGGKVVSP